MCVKPALLCPQVLSIVLVGRHPLSELSASAAYLVSFCTANYAITQEMIWGNFMVFFFSPTLQSSFKLGRGKKKSSTTGDEGHTQTAMDTDSVGESPDIFMIKAELLATRVSNYDRIKRIDQTKGGGGET